MGEDLIDERVNCLVRRLEWLRYMREHAQYVIATGSYRVGIVENFEPTSRQMSAYSDTTDRGASAALCSGLASCTDVPRGIDAAILATQEELRAALVEMDRDYNNMRSRALALLGEVRP